MKNVCTKNLVLQIDQGNLDNLSENTRVEQTHDGSGQPDERNSSSAHTVKEQFAPEENRDIALFNTDNEFNRAINEEDIDFNIPGLPHSAVKQPHGTNVQGLIQKIENHPHRQALQSDLQQRQQFNPFSNESKDMIRAAGNIELCELLDVQPKAQCKICLSYWQCLLHVRALLARWIGGAQAIRQVHSRSPLDSQLLHQERATPRSPLREEAWGSRVLHREFAQKRNARRDISWVLTTGSSVMRSFAKNMIELGRSEEICREMDKLANEDHTHHITPDEIRVYRNNWWIRSNIVSSDTMPVRHRADFRQALTTLRQLKNQEDTAYYQNWQSSSSSWWNWQESWWYSSSEHHHDDGPSTDRSGKRDGR